MSKKQRKRKLNKRRNRARALNRGILTYNGIKGTYASNFVNGMFKDNGNE